MTFACKNERNCVCYNHHYVRNHQTTLHSFHQVKENLDHPYHSSSHYHCSSHHKRPSCPRPGISLPYHMKTCYSVLLRCSKMLKKCIKQINNVFIIVILFLFYFVGIGFGALIYFFFKREKRKSTYWQEVKNEKIDLSSPY